MNEQLFELPVVKKGLRQFLPFLTADINSKGVLDVDTVKGCYSGMAVRPDGGCYNACYAAKIAKYRGFDFSVSVTRLIASNEQRTEIERAVINSPHGFFRIGTMGDPCHAWEHTVKVVEWLSKFARPVIITKHWIRATDQQLKRLIACHTVLNVSISALDRPPELAHRVREFHRFKDLGGDSVARIVSCDFNRDNDEGKLKAAIQDALFELNPVLDNPLRVEVSHPLVTSGVIRIERKRDLNSDANISLYKKDAYVGHCDSCPDLCGLTMFDKRPEFLANPKVHQIRLFEETNMGKKKNETEELFTATEAIGGVEFIHVPKVLDSEYSDPIAKLAIEDGVAYRAARKNMQIHSAIVLKIGGVFSGFFTFQVNHEVGEFCLLQSAMTPGKEDKEIYCDMLREIIKQNTFGYPMVMTVSTKHELERPSVLASVGFKTYLILSGYEYMVYGTFEQVRLKRLAHATMTNTWNSTKGDWLKMKREWNAKIEEAGKKHGVKNPKYASREGAWQGANGMANVVLQTRKIEGDEIKVDKSKSLNSNVSVLDPVACEVILRFFMPKDGKRVYNPFGGGVQFGFVTGDYGFEYLSSEIRQNQCDANNLICSDFPNVRWQKSDSATFEPEGIYDLIFTCPPYYKVEKYLDYDGKPPAGEINSLSSYDSFRDTLFAGYRIAIKHLRENGFFVVMTGDSRDKNGAYYCSESETELFFKNEGLSVYNKIIYLEAEFTRLAQAKVTLNVRKFPKREQKIIVAYKGNTDKIKDNFAKIGRL